MDPHLAHKLPWASLGDVIKLKRDSRTADRKDNSVQLGLKEIKAVYHFARCFAAAIEEFAASDASTEDEKRAYDPTTWDLIPFSRPYEIGYYNSLIEGYVELNLLLMDPLAFTHSHMYTCEWESAACGWGFDAHPEWLTTHLRQAFDGQGKMKPITAVVLQILRDHCAKFFRCLYSISGDNCATEPDYVVHKIANLFNFRRDLDLCREAAPDVFTQQRRFPAQQLLE